MSTLSTVVASASAYLAATGRIVHLFETCTADGTVNARPDAEGIACIACQINAVAADLEVTRDVR